MGLKGFQDAGRMEMDSIFSIPVSLHLPEDPAPEDIYP